jgi:hypothetical protein
MAEQEVVKHTKKVYKIWTSKKHSPWEKIREFAVEVLIIVFAVTLSIWLHERSEHSKHKKEVKEFLLGLKQDLTSDISEMSDDINSYEKSGMAYQYLTSVKTGEGLNPDSVRFYRNSLFNQTKLVPNIGRFEGFKSSGKIGFIEDEELQNDIMDLYQENIPALTWGADYYNGLKKALREYCYANTKRAADGSSDFTAVLATDPAFNRASDLSYTDEIIGRYNQCITKSKKIIAAINKLYDLK